MKNFKAGLLREAWLLAKPYWRSEEKWVAWGFLAAIIALNLGSVYIDVRLNEWRNAFYNTLQEMDGPGFLKPHRSTAMPDSSMPWSAISFFSAARLALVGCVHGEGCGPKLPSSTPS